MQQQAAPSQEIYQRLGDGPRVCDFVKLSERFRALNAAGLKFNEKEIAALKKSLDEAKQYVEDKKEGLPSNREFSDMISLVKKRLDLLPKEIVDSQDTEKDKTKKLDMLKGFEEYIDQDKLKTEKEEQDKKEDGDVKAGQAVDSVGGASKFATLDSAGKNILNNNINPDRAELKKHIQQAYEVLQRCVGRINNKNLIVDLNHCIQLNYAVHDYKNLNNLRHIIELQVKNVFARYTINNPSEDIVKAYVNWYVDLVSVGATHLEVGSDGKFLEHVNTIVDHLKTDAFWAEVKKKTGSQGGAKKDSESSEEYATRLQAISTMLDDERTVPDDKKLNIQVSLDQAGNKHFYIPEITESNADAVCKRMVDEFYNKKCINWVDLDVRVQPKVEEYCLRHWKRFKMNGGAMDDISKTMPEEHSLIKWYQHIGSEKKQAEFLTRVIDGDAGLLRDLYLEPMDQKGLKNEIYNKLSAEQKAQWDKLIAADRPQPVMPQMPVMPPQ